MAYSVVESNPPKHGGRVTYRLQPRPEEGCVFRVYVEGQRMRSIGDTAGGLRLRSIHSDGSIEFDVVGDPPSGTVRFEVECGDSVENPSISIGSSVTDPPPSSGEDDADDEYEPLDLDSVTIRVTNWPWWRRLLGFCPKTWKDEEGNICTHVGDTGNIVTIIYNRLHCQYRCGSRLITVKFSLLFGVLLSSSGD